MSVPSRYDNRITPGNRSNPESSNRSVSLLCGWDAPTQWIGMSKSTNHSGRSVGYPFSISVNMPPMSLTGYSCRAAARMTSSFLAGGPLYRGSIARVCFNSDQNNWGCAPSRAFREGALPDCRHLTLRCPEAAPRPFSSHFSCTAITDTESQSCNNSPTL
jgi:hypothetical protein